MLKVIKDVVENVGHFSSYTLPLGVIVGLLVPSAADIFKSYLIPTLFIPLTLSLLCTPNEKFISALANKRLIVSAIIWVLLVSPILVWVLVSLVDIPESIALAAVLAAAAPPVAASAAIAIFLRLNSAVAACVTICSMLIVPLTLPLVLRNILGIKLDLDLWSISFQLVAFIFISFGVAVFFKRLFKEKEIAKRKLMLDGISVISISLFTIGIMSGLSEMAADRPWFLLENILVSSTLVLGLYSVTTLVYWRAGPNSSMAIAIASGNCNLGLMYLVLVDKAPPDVLIFFSIGQIPMYILPTLLVPIVKALRHSVSAK